MPSKPRTPKAPADAGPMLDDELEALRAHFERRGTSPAEAQPLCMLLAAQVAVGGGASAEDFHAQAGRMFARAVASLVPADDGTAPARTA